MQEEDGFLSQSGGTTSWVDHCPPCIHHKEKVDLDQHQRVIPSTLLGWISLLFPGRRPVHLHHSRVEVKNWSWLACEEKLNDLMRFAAITTRILVLLVHHQKLLQPTQQRRLNREGVTRAKTIALHDHEVREINRPGNIGLEHELAHHRDVQN